MNIFAAENNEFQNYIDKVETIIAEVSPYASKEEMNKLKQLVANFKIKTDDFYRENRKLNIGVVGQVKAGKSSFLNSLLFDGRKILPKAATPKTATLTKMEYSEENIIQIEYYSPDEWETLEDNATVDLDNEIFTSAREIVGMVQKNRINPYDYLEKGTEKIRFDTYNDLIENLNDYVGENGKYTPIVKAVTLFLNNDEFKDISIVDTPGLNDPIASRTIRTKEFMEVCDVVFFLSQSTSFLDKSDWNLLSSQLPQKGVKRLSLIASKYDSGVRDVLREQDEDDIFGDDDGFADNIPGACKIVKGKLTKRAKSKTAEFIRDLEAREASPELIEVIKQCANPMMVSSIVYNMAGKPVSEYTSEEKNVYNALKRFSSNTDVDFKLMGNVDEVRAVFNEVVIEKEKILEQKSKSFIPNANEELKDIIRFYIDKNEKSVQVLESNDKETLFAQKAAIEKQINNIKADVLAIFNETKVKLESEKLACIGELRNTSKDYIDLKEREGVVTRTTSHTKGHLFWKKTVYETHDEHYLYCLAADVVENLSKFSLDATNQIEEVFSQAISSKELKRKLLEVIINNFDTGSEKYDSSLFKLMVEETLGGISFPTFDVNISKESEQIIGKFNGEIKSAAQKNALSTALIDAVSKIRETLCGKLNQKVSEVGSEMLSLASSLQGKLIDDLNKEFEDLFGKCENKEKEISMLKEYNDVLLLKLSEI